MLKYGSHFNLHFRPTCDGASSLSMVFSIEEMCVLSSYFQDRRVPIRYVCVSGPVRSSCWCGKNNYIKRLATNLFPASIFHVACPESHGPYMHCIVLLRISLYLWISILGIYSARQTFDILLPAATSHTRLEKPSSLSPQHSYNC